jgi:hypothetical protein
LALGWMEGWIGVVNVFGICSRGMYGFLRANGSEVDLDVG